jgi:hypothetical protein
VYSFAAIATDAMAMATKSAVPTRNNFFMELSSERLGTWGTGRAAYPQATHEHR